MFESNKRYDIYKQLGMELLEQTSRRNQKVQSRREKDGVSIAESQHEKLIEKRYLTLVTALAEARSMLSTPVVRTNRYFSGRHYYEAIELIVPHVASIEKLYLSTARLEEADRFDLLYRWLMDKLHRRYQQKKDSRFDETFLIEEPVWEHPESQDGFHLVPSSDDDEIQVDDAYLDSVPGMMFFEPDAPAPA